jgi:hypothetical protein
MHSVEDEIFEHGSPRRGILEQTTIGRRNRAWETVGLFDLLDRFERDLGPAARTPRATN